MSPRQLVCQMHNMNFLLVHLYKKCPPTYQIEPVFMLKWAQIKWQSAWKFLFYELEWANISSCLIYSWITFQPAPCTPLPTSVLSHPFHLCSGNTKYEHKQNTIQGEAFVENNKRVIMKYIPKLSINSRVHLPRQGQLMFNDVLNSKVSRKALEIDFFHKLWTLDA